MPQSRYVFLMAVCGCILLSGFFFAARQHFASIDYGIRNSNLRKQIDELEAEKRRLLLAREIALSPAELKNALAKVGSRPAPASPEIKLAKRVETVPTKQVPKGDEIARLVKTAPVQAKAITAAFSQPVVTDKKKPQPAKAASLPPVREVAAKADEPVKRPRVAVQLSGR